MNRIGLFLDDVRIIDEKPRYIDEWYTVRSYNEFVEFITTFYGNHKELPKLLSLDHDLSTEHYTDYQMKPLGSPIMYSKFKEKTGMDCAKWLCVFCEENNISLKDTKIAVHSFNPMGATNIQSYINNYKKSKDADQDCFTFKWKYREE